MVRPTGRVTPDSSRDLFIKTFGKPIEEYDSFKRATLGMSDLTMKAVRRFWPYYFLYLNQTPDQVIAQRKKDLMSDDDACERYEKLTVAFIKQEQKTLAGKTVACHLARIQGFFTNNGKRLSLDMPKMRINKARKIRKYSPSVEEVRTVFNRADSKRDRFIVALMAQNGPAPVDVSLLCVGDYPLEAWQYFERSRSKTGQVWRGVSTPDVCECLKEYLIVRGKTMAGERLLVGREGALDHKAVSQVVHDLIVKAGFGEIVGFKPTSLRDFFEDSLSDAEIYRKTKETLMGHGVGDIEQEYGGYKKMVERLVEAAKKVYPLICLNEVNLKSQTPIYSPEQYKKIDQLLENFDVYMKVAGLMEKGKLKVIGKLTEEKEK